MPFVSRPGLNGKVYVPEQLSGQKKHNCNTCFACQVCGDDRCNLCLGQTGEKADDCAAVTKPNVTCKEEDSGISRC
jgi:hypothetical protein